MKLVQLDHRLEVVARHSRIVVENGEIADALRRADEAGKGPRADDHFAEAAAPGRSRLAGRGRRHGIEHIDLHTCAKHGADREVGMIVVSVGRRRVRRHVVGQAVAELDDRVRRDVAERQRLHRAAHMQVHDRVVHFVAERDGPPEDDRADVFDRLRGEHFLDERRAVAVAEFRNVDRERRRERRIREIELREVRHVAGAIAQRESAGARPAQRERDEVAVRIVKRARVRRVENVRGIELEENEILDARRGKFFHRSARIGIDHVRETAREKRAASFVHVNVEEVCDRGIIDLERLVECERAGVETAHEFRVKGAGEFRDALARIEIDGAGENSDCEKIARAVEEKLADLVRPSRPAESDRLGQIAVRVELGQERVAGAGASRASALD